MANTAVGTIYKALKDNYEPGTYTVVYPYGRDSTTVPYIYLYEVDDPRIQVSLCERTGGEARITIGLIEEKFDTCLDGIEAIITFVKSLRGGSYSSILLWDIYVSGVRDLADLEQSASRKFRREFDCIVRWEAT